MKWLLLSAPSVLLAIAAVSVAKAAPGEHSPLPPGYKILFEENFQHADALGQFQMSDPKAWQISLDRTNAALELVTQSKYEPPVRSPVNIALIGNKSFGDFVLEADLIQTGKEYGHRDMCLFFGFQAPDQFYYAHIATAADDHAHNLFIVNKQPRTKIAEQTTKGVNWGLGVWHKVRLERKSSDGSIRLYFDDMSRPIMVAHDRTFATGYIGFGSFDDTGKIDNIRIWGPSFQEQTGAVFPLPKPDAASAPSRR